MKPSVLLSPTTPFLPNLQNSTSRFNHLLSVNPQFLIPQPRSAPRCSCSTSLIASNFGPTKPFHASNSQAQTVEEMVEKGCTVVAAAFLDYSVNRGKVIILLLEAIDIYLLGTVMLVFGMGMYELFISNLDIAKAHSDDKDLQGSNLFGLFSLRQRPKWLEIKSVNELKTKLGHVIVMLLLIGLFDKSKKAAIHSPTDLLCFSASVLLSSGCLYLLSKLNGSI